MAFCVGSGTSSAGAPLEVAFSVPRGRRLNRKMSAVDTPYEGLVVTGSRAEQRKRAAIVKSINFQSHRSAKVAASAALATIRQNVGNANLLIDRHGVGGREGC